MPSIKPLTKKQIDAYTSKHANWKCNNAKTKMVQTFSFDTFVTALAFCAKIAVHAELLNHHPELLIQGNKVKVTLHTHDIKGLSRLDFELAERIDNLKTT